MSATTYFDTKTGWRARIKSALKTFFANVIAAREAEARRLVASHVALYENSRLRQENASRKQTQKAAPLVQV